jgi:rhodanese-related sulfurtransferase
VPNEAYEEIKGGDAVLIDVRTRGEFAGTHAEPAQLIPLHELNRRAVEIPEGKHVFVICHSGGRSAMAAGQLRARGRSNVTNVVGGTCAWKAAGLPIVAAKRTAMPLDAQLRGIAGLLTVVFSALGLTVNHWYGTGALFIGFMLFQSAITGFCPMMNMLAKMPWNRGPSSPVD